MSVTAPAVIDPFEKALMAISALGPGGSFTLSGLIGSSKAYFLSRILLSIKKPILTILPDQQGAEDFSRDLKFFLGEENVLFYPSAELLPFETQTLHPDISAKRTEFLFRLLSLEKPVFMVTAASNLLERVIPKETLRKKTLKLSIGGEYPREGLIAALAGMGYERMSMVEERAEMSIRGGILDIYPPVEKYPVRIEFFGDEVESIRTFDPVNQRSQRELAEVLLLPARQSDLSYEGKTLAKEKLLERVNILGIKREEWEPLYNKIREGANIEGVDTLLPLFHEKLDTLFDYIAKDAFIAILDPSGTDSEVARFTMDVIQRSSDKKTFIKPEELYLSGDFLGSALKGYPLILVEPLKSAGLEVKTESNLDLRQDIAVKKELSPLRERLREWSDRGFSVYISAHNRAQAERMTELLEGFSTVIAKGTEILEGKKTPSIKILEGALSGGFRIASEKVAVVTEEEVFGERYKRRAPPAKKLDTFLTSLKDLSEGDFIVHATHGIGLYRGLFRLSPEGVESDFLLIEYRDSDKLYVPVGKMDLVSKYHGVEGKIPSLDKLGAKGWEKRKGRVKEAAALIAGELIKLYAERTVAPGYAFSRPGKLFTEFAAGFEYDETPDQEKAIEDVMKDMGEARPMDRLICGDVGYGKTEVAMRAAFRAVLDNKQVSILVPTTVLAQQHFLTFTKRFAPFPAAVDVLSRFRSKKEQIEVLSKLREGAIDIIIGTHRLLQKDVEFKDMGLVVIDEEHRFGVKDKERLKELKKEVDVLTLTATPIPRTLHMTLADVRDLSIINTPPEDRLAIVTRIIRLEPQLIKEAVERELKRGGQVFFVHNRVQNIGEMHEYLKNITSGIKPDVRIAVAHGQMPENALEKVMLGFVNRDYDILLSTTIIESGLDIPSANTIIVNRADTFGLAELYQLRGRVGRSNHRAYAYFICPDDALLTPEASKRIEVIRELSDLGSGFRIAAYDLEIRGAGELLGKAQSGQIAEVGFDMYAQILEETVMEMRGEGISGHEPAPEINLRIPVYIPEDYIPDTRQRLTLYKRLATCETHDELVSLKEEILDRYGNMPGVLENLFEITELKLRLKPLGVKELSRKKTRLYVTFSKAKCPEGVAERIVCLMENKPERFLLTPDGTKLIFSMEEDKEALSSAKYLLQELANRC